MMPVSEKGQWLTDWIRQQRTARPAPIGAEDDAGQPADFSSGRRGRALAPERSHGELMAEALLVASGRLPKPPKDPYVRA
jgi:hypothetical protein